MALLAYVCSLLGETQYGTLLYDLLSPHAGTLVTLGDTWACLGAADRFLGIYAALKGEEVPAEQHFRAALAFEEKLSSPTHVAYTRYWWARMLPSCEGASELLDKSVAAAFELGMAQLEKEARALRTV